MPQLQVFFVWTQERSLCNRNEFVIISIKKPLFQTFLIFHRHAEIETFLPLLRVLWKHCKHETAGTWWPGLHMSVTMTSIKCYLIFWFCRWHQCASKYNKNYFSVDIWNTTNVLPRFNRCSNSSQGFVEFSSIMPLVAVHALQTNYNAWLSKNATFPGYLCFFRIKWNSLKERAAQQSLNLRRQCLAWVKVS